ncbi:MAG: hypothetical protein DMG25_16565 [Acidobacteria bacterium]|nr:MAG: hypothetical protein DMG25_16565 [Acidobacteriota bacterium]
MRGRRYFGGVAPVYFALSEGARQERDFDFRRHRNFGRRPVAGVAECCAARPDQKHETILARPPAGATALEARLVLAFVGLNHGVGPELPACAPTPWRESSTGRPGAAPSVHPQPHEGR